jgi:pimeloyl-ACP methyl ester carboxylesterase
MRRIGVVLGVLAGTWVVAGIAGSIYERVAERRDAARLPQVGHSVDIGGRSLNIFCSGEGAPVVVLDSGNGEPGMVLVDAAHEDEPRRAPRFMLGRTAPQWLWHPIWIVAQSARATGLVRLLTPRADRGPHTEHRTREEIVRALRRQPKSVTTLLAEASTPVSYAQAESAGGLGDRPLVVLTRGKVNVPPNPTAMDREAAAYEQVWMHEIQPKLARLSTRGRQIIVERSGHGIPEEAPEAVIDAVRQVVSDVRRVHTPQP